MNIVEVLRQAKPGQKIRRPCWGNSLEESAGGMLIWDIAGEDGSGDYMPLSHDLTADDWEIVKQPRKWEGEITLHGASNICKDGDGFIAWMEGVRFDGRYSENGLPRNKPCKVTIEWEE